MPIVSEGRWEEECVAPNSGGSSLIRCLQYSRGPDFVQCNMGMDDMRPLHALDGETVRLRYCQICHGFLYSSLIQIGLGAVLRLFR